MAEYRDVEPLRKQITEFKKATNQFIKDSSFLEGYISVIDAVMEIIEKLDVQEVVRCKDCEYRKTEDCAMQYECECGAQYFWESDNAFCSRGRRKDGEENG